jgi:CRISPR-associated protein (TIGR03984 family)
VIDVKSKFDKSAWAYAVFYDRVQVGYWNGERLIFHDREFSENDMTEEDGMTELRVFDGERELRYVRLPDDTLAARYIDDNGKAPDVSDLYYAVYGEDAESTAGWTRRFETRGGDLWIPADLKDANLYLKVRNYFKWNGVPVGRDGADDSDIKPNPGPLEFSDFRFASFFADGDGKWEVSVSGAV